MLKLVRRGWSMLGNRCGSALHPGNRYPQATRIYGYFINRELEPASQNLSWSIIAGHIG